MKLFKVSFGPGETADIEIVGISDNTLKQIFFYQGPRSNFDIGGAHYWLNIWRGGGGGGHKTHFLTNFLKF